MIGTDVAPTTQGTTRRTGVVMAAVAAAVAVNLLVYGVGRLAGGTYTFTRDDGSITVDVLTVAGFSAVPLGLGLTTVALLVGRHSWVAEPALVIAPVLAVVTIGIMTIQADFDRVSTFALATCHLTLVPISVLAIHRLRR